MKTAAAVFATLVLVLVLIGFGSAHEASAAIRDLERKGSCTIVYSDGNFSANLCRFPVDAKRQVTCVATTGGYGRGLTCDWDHVAKG